MKALKQLNPSIILIFFAVLFFVFAGVWNLQADSGSLSLQSSDSSSLELNNELQDENF